VVKLRRAEGHREAVGAMGAGEPTVGRFGEVRGDTVHFDIIDQAGNMISATPSGGWLQSSPVIPELGFCLGSRAQMFWLEEGHPARWRRASARAPRSRPPWRCATASRTWPGARPAATSRINGPRSSSCATSTPA
jgi:gamma-glutamyltranspeptidase